MVDRRTDVWAFACVLFEMLTGRRTFDGSSVVDAIGAALHKEPEWHLLPKTTPPAVRATLERCLQKDPRQRARDLGDVRLALDGGFSPPVDASSGPYHQLRDGGRWRSPCSATSLVVGAAAWIARRPPATPVRTPVRFRIRHPWGLSSATSLSLSPDGRTLVFQALGQEEVVVLAALVRNEHREDADARRTERTRRSSGRRTAGHSPSRRRAN